MHDYISMVSFSKKNKSMLLLIVKIKLHFIILNMRAHREIICKNIHAYHFGTKIIQT